MAYIDALRNPQLGPPIVFAFIARIPLYLTPLALALWGAEDLSMTLVGTVLAAFSLGSAAGGPLAAYFSDRFGSSPVLAVSGGVHAVALLASVQLGTSMLPVTCAVTFVAGACIPPVSATLRGYMSQVSDGNQRNSAFALESVVGEVLTILGPLLLSMILLLGDPSRGLLFSGGLTAVGAVLLSLVSPIKNFGSRPANEKAAVKMGSQNPPLRNRGFRALTVRRALEAIANGAFDIAIPATALTLGNATFAGPLYASMGIGAIVGGLLFGALRCKSKKETLYCLGLTLTAVGLAFPLIAWDFWSMLCALALGATVVAPVAAVEFDLVSRVSSESSRQQAYAWMTTAGVIGSTVGVQVGGYVIDMGSVAWGFLLAFLVALIAAVFSWPFRHLWSEPSSQVEAPAKMGGA